MASFVDTQGRTWLVRLNFGLVEDIKEQTGIDFLSPSLPDVLREVSQSPRKFVEALWVCCEAAAEKSGVTPEDFGHSLDGDTLSDAESALLQALVDFTRRPMRAVAQETMKMAQAAEKKLAENAMEKLRQPDLVDVVVREMLSQDGESGKSPESLGINPRPHSLRELMWMLEGWREEEWMRTASIEACVLNASPNRRKGKGITPTELHPFLNGSKQQRGIPLAQMGIQMFSLALKSSRRRK